MKELVIGVTILSAIVLAPIGINMHQAASVASATSAYDEYIHYEEYDRYEEAGPQRFRTTARLNLRQGPTTDSARIMTANPGQLVYVTDVRDGVWFAVEVNGQTGYMYAEFLVEVAEGAIVAPDFNGTVERLHWSEARELTTRGTPLTLVDVRTGITWQVASFSNGNHADVEPITAEDTAAMLSAFGRWC